MSTPFMQLYVADYLGDTQHLTTEQHGAYLLLLMTMWRAGGSIPDDDTKLARIVRLSVSRWRKVRGDIIEFFEVDDGLITQKRLTSELQKAQEKSEKRADAGRRGGIAKSLNANEPAVANASVLPKHSPEPEPEPESESKTSLRSDSITPSKPVRAPRRSEPETFSTFWETYPRKISRGAAVKAYTSALSRASPEIILAGAKRYAEARRNEDPQYTAHASSWLNQDRWLDQLDKPHGTNGNHRKTNPSAGNQSFLEGALLYAGAGDGGREEVSRPGQLALTDAGDGDGGGDIERPH